MNYMGIDVSKYKHDAFIISAFGDIINEGFSFTNDACAVSPQRPRAVHIILV